MEHIRAATSTLNAEAQKSGSLLKSPKITSHIAELMKIVDELRHLEGFKGTIGVSELHDRERHILAIIFHDAHRQIESNNHWFRKDHNQILRNIWWYVI